MGLPAVQIFMIMARQASKPVADRLMTYGKSHPFFRDKVLVPIGRGIVNLTTRLRMKNLGLGAPTTLAPISETTALEQSSEFIQQVVIFGYSVGVFAAYHYYSKANEKQVVLAEDFRQLLTELDTRFAYLEKRLDDVDKQIHDINLGLVGKAVNIFRSKSEPLPKQPQVQSLASSLPFDDALKRLQPQGTKNAENRTVMTKSPPDASELVVAPS